MSCLPYNSTQPTVLLQSHSAQLHRAPDPYLSPNTPLQTHSATPIVVTMGLTPLALGNTLASTTHNALVPHTLPFPSTTPFRGSTAIRHVPI